MKKKYTLKKQKNIVKEDANKDILLKKIREQLYESFNNYNKVISYMSADVPISVLCLSKNAEKQLTSQGIIRVYDLFGLDFAEIEGLSDRDRADLTSRFNQLLSVG